MKIEKIEFLTETKNTKDLAELITNIYNKVQELIDAHNASLHPVEEEDHDTWNATPEEIEELKDELRAEGKPVEVGEKECEHEYGDMMLLSIPPQYRCIKCGETTTRKFEAKYTVAEAEPKAQESWEKEFDKQTPNFDEAFTVQDTLYTEYKYPESEYELDYQKVKDFISKALQQQKEEIVDLIDREYLEYCRKQNGRDDCKNCGLDKEGLSKLLESRKD